MIDAKDSAQRSIMKNIDWRALSFALITSLSFLFSFTLVASYTKIIYSDGDCQQIVEALKQNSNHVAVTYAESGYTGLSFYISIQNLIYIFLIILVISTLIFYWAFKVLNRKKK